MAAAHDEHMMLLQAHLLPSQVTTPTQAACSLLCCRGGFWQQKTRVPAVEGKAWPVDELTVQMTAAPAHPNPAGKA